MMGYEHTHKHDAEQPLQVDYIKRDFVINIKLIRISMTALASARNDVHLWAGLHISEIIPKKKRKEQMRREEKEEKRREEKRREEKRREEKRREEKRREEKRREEKRREERRREKEANK